MCCLTGVEHTRNLVGDGRYAGCYAVYKLPQARGVVLGREHEVGCLVLYEVGLMLGQVLLVLGGSVLACETVGVFSVGQEQQLYVHTLGQQHVYAPFTGVYARLVAVVDDGDIVGHAVYEAYLVGGEGSTR